MSQPEDKVAIELHMFAPREENGIVELLFATAHFHRNKSNLDLHHTINFGRPWLDQSLLENGFISLPYLDWPKFEKISLDSEPVRFLWVIPILKQEAEFNSQHGPEKLEQRFEAVSVNYLDPNRNSVLTND
jgi:hypothetical protein